MAGNVSCQILKNYPFLPLSVLICTLFVPCNHKVLIIKLSYILYRKVTTTKQPNTKSIINTIKALLEGLF